MEFEWDPSKDAANQQKHGISFVAATAVFDDPDHIEEDSTKPEYGEIRNIAIGRLGDGRLVTVAFTDRGSVRRIISVRIARNYERRKYNQGKATP
jgi:uncharacterized DUF497 family protein